MEEKKFIKVEHNKERKKHIRNKIFVNLITSLRSLGTIAIVPVYFLGGSLMAGLAAMGFFVTDFIDGQLARRLHVESFFGSLLDGLSDKAFGIVCLLLLATVNPLFLGIIGVELGILVINYKSIKRGNNAQSSLAGKMKTLLLAGTIVGSFFCHSVPTLKELLDYVHVQSFQTLLEINPAILSSMLAIPTLGASLYVAKDYSTKAKKQDEERKILKESSEKLNICIESEKSEYVETEELSLETIARRKEELREKKQELEELKQLKTGKEIAHDLFDTPFYLAHRNDGIKKLFYK